MATSVQNFRTFTVTSTEDKVLAQGHSIMPPVKLET